MRGGREVKRRKLVAWWRFGRLGELPTGRELQHMYVVLRGSNTPIASEDDIFPAGGGG